ncbi:hypothetical protein D3C83_329090 [compost metagenome]
MATKGDLGDSSYVAAIDIRSGRTIWRSPNLIGWPAPRSLNAVDWGAPNGPSLSLGTSTGMILTR